MAMQKERILIGSFFFRDEGDGCITGKYFNSGMNSPLIEASKFINTVTSTKKFCGIYNTLWLDTVTDPSGLVILEIQPKTDDIDKLLWSDAVPPHATCFLGEAMLVDDLMVGCYWSTNVRPDGY
jgi:hypothetical protein